jgi:catechol 2,3-dioxygenase-like lactoylglutathione lyase family enzyme
MRFHHVNLAVHPDVLDAEIEYLLDGIGMKRLEAPAEFAELAKWFDFPDGAQIHLSPTTDAVATKPGHVAVVFGDQLEVVAARMAARGLETRGIDGPAGAIKFVTDPAGHLWELRANA